jgi:hypothetical protein
MPDLMSPAFFTAGTTDISTDAADIFRKLRPARHESNCDGTNPGAIAIQIDAARHHFYIVLLQTGAGAMFTHGGALVAGLDTASKFFVHDFSFGLMFDFEVGCHIGIS